MDRKPLFFLIVGMTGLSALLAFNFIGSTIDAQGFLHEPFFLLSVGYLLAVVGFGFGFGGAAILMLCQKIRRA